MNANVKAIAEAWRKSFHLPSVPNLTPRSREICTASSCFSNSRTLPAKNRGDTPTARAISERLIKIRATCKTTGGAHFSVASAQTKAVTANGAPHTPRRRGPHVGPSGQSSRSSTAGKRKRSETKPGGGGASDAVAVNGEGPADAGARVKREGSSAGDSDAESPSKRVRALELGHDDVFGNAIDGLTADGDEEV